MGKLPSAIMATIETEYNPGDDSCKNLYFAVIGNAILEALSKRETKERQQAQKFLRDLQDENGLSWFCELAGIANPKLISEFLDQQQKKKTFFQKWRKARNTKRIDNTYRNGGKN